MIKTIKRIIRTLITLLRKKYSEGEEEMARKRKWGITSGIRYRVKMFRFLGYGIPENLAMELSEAVTNAFSAGFGMFRQIRQKVTTDPRWGQVPTGLRGLYLAFVNELVHKAFMRGISDPNEIIDKWARLGLNRDLLTLVYEIAFEAFTAETRPAQKAQ